MSILDLYGYASTLWVVWLMAVFVGIIVWAYWPSRKQELESHCDIPLRDDEPVR